MSNVIHMKRRIIQIIFTDGRRALLDKMISSFKEHLDFTDTTLVFKLIVDDSGDDIFHHRLKKDYSAEHFILRTGASRQGFAESIKFAWNVVRENNSLLFLDYVLHLEDDFELLRHTYVKDMIRVLECRPELAQVALLRDPCNAAEMEAGGLLRFMSKSNWLELDSIDGINIVEHGEFFTTNPSIYRVYLPKHFRWPDPPDSERVFGWSLQQCGFRFAFLGGINDDPIVKHIGQGRRVGKGY